MLILQHPDVAARLDLLFGLGVIGNEVRRALLRQPPVAEAAHAFSWQPPAQPAEGDAIAAEVAARCRRLADSGRPVRINVVWSAGRGGFDLTAAAFADELASFRRVTDLAAALARRADARVAFHMLSSAGGLFEGQTGVAADSAPAPRRLYGSLKLAQEEHLASHPGEFERHVYRPSTVYGFAGFEKRMGLIVRLIWDKIGNRVTEIFGSLQTTRDYLLVSDAARFIAARMADAPAGRRDCRTWILASGKPTTINEVIRVIDRVVPGRSYLLLRPTKANCDHNSFRPAALPPGLTPTDLETGIRLTYSRMIHRAQTR
jgi:UDP-glucose 4-epimerase